MFKGLLVVFILQVLMQASCSAYRNQNGEPTTINEEEASIYKDRAVKFFTKLGLEFLEKLFEGLDSKLESKYRFKNYIKSVEEIRVDVYFESLCPDSRKFIANQLWPIFEEFHDTASFKLSMYPYGNANSTWVGNRWNFTCQHGPEECSLNLIATCVIRNYPTPAKYFPFIKCVEEKPSEQQVKTCAMESNVDLDLIRRCVKSKQGNLYEYQMGLKTPAHSFIPWIQINGEGSDEINNKALVDLKGLVCAAYKGVKPVQCTTAQQSIP